MFVLQDDAQSLASSGTSGMRKPTAIPADQIKVKDLEKQVIKLFNPKH